MANQQHGKYIHLLNVISGIVFLGTPHSCTDLGSLADKSLLILKSYPHDFNKQSVARLEKEASLLLNAARRFEDIILRVDIASVYETKEIKIKEGANVFSKTRKAIVSRERDQTLVQALKHIVGGHGLCIYQSPSRNSYRFGQRSCHALVFDGS